jgi:hypothetical protein
MNAAWVRKVVPILLILAAVLCWLFVDSLPLLISLDFLFLLLALFYTYRLAKNWFPHALAVTAFLAVSVLYCKPSLDGKVLNQTDVIGHKGMVQQSNDYKEKYGHFPLWTESLFGGMPTYTIQMRETTLLKLGDKEIKLNVVNYLAYFLTLGMDPYNPIALFFVAALCFYLLTQILRINPWIGFLSSIGFAYSTFDPIIIAVGHVTQMLAIGICPAVIAGLLLVYRKQYWTGAAMMTIAFGLQASMTQHIQIIYYTCLIVGLITIIFFIRSWKQKALPEALKALVFVILASAIGFCTYANVLLPDREYATETMRGGKSELSGNAQNKTKGGLDKDYAFDYSYGIGETLTLYVPGAYGDGNLARPFPDESKLADKLEEIGWPEDRALQFANESPYWGALPIQAGPVYLGVIVGFLFILGIAFAKSWHKEWLIAAAVVGILLAWGKYFSVFNYFLFDHLPFYKSFRSPSMALVMPQLALPLLGALGLDEFLRSAEPKEIIWKKFRTVCLVCGGFLVLALLYYAVASFKGPHDDAFHQNFVRGTVQQMARGSQPTAEMQQQANAQANGIVKAMEQDRESIFIQDLLRSFILLTLAVVLTGLFLRGKIKALPLLISLILLSSFDLIAEDRKFMNEDNFLDPVDVESFFAPTMADQQIMADPDKSFRVFDETGGSGPFNDSRSSYRFNSVGGYSPAKLGLYQDLIEKQLSKGNLSVFNMLNTRYFIQANSTSRQPEAHRNPSAYGPCWLVKGLNFVPNADAEMQALDSMNLRDTAILRSGIASKVPFQPVWDSSARVRLLDNRNDELSYAFAAKSNQFVVFSEIYYDKGWNAYLDGKKTDYFRVDYLLRGMAVPAGDHRIEFRFEPLSFDKGTKIALIGSLMAYVLLGTAVWRGARSSKPPGT